MRISGSTASAPAFVWLTLTGFLLWLSACGAPPDPDAKPNSLVVTVDTLRADYVGAYGVTQVRTPHLDRLAAEGMLFENATRPIPVTKPSHFSLLTSLYPRDHGVVNDELHLPPDVETLPEIFRAQGYETAAFVASALLSREAGAANTGAQADLPRGSVITPFLGPKRSRP